MRKWLRGNTRKKGKEYDLHCVTVRAASQSCVHSFPRFSALFSTRIHTIVSAEIRGNLQKSSLTLSNTQISSVFVCAVTRIIIALFRGNTRNNKLYNTRLIPESIELDSAFYVGALDYSTNMPHLSIEQRCTAVQARREGKGYKAIVKLLQGEYNVTVNKRTIKKLCQVSIQGIYIDFFL